MTVLRSARSRATRLLSIAIFLVCPARRLASGVYFYRLETGDGYHETRKLVMVQ